MNKRLPLLAIGHATSLLLSITFTICVIFDLLFPQYAMYQAWQAFLPGFNWISWSSYFIGLTETYLYGWYFALTWTGLYNVFINSTLTSNQVISKDAR